MAADGCHVEISKRLRYLKNHLINL